MTRVSRIVAGVAAAAVTVAIAAAGAPQAPRRIVSVVPAVTEMLFALGAGPAVVGVSTFDRYPPEVSTRPTVGALVDPDFERVLTLKPDLVVVYGTQTEFIGRLTRAGIPVFRYEHAGLADVTDTIKALGVRVGRAADGDRLTTRILADIEAIKKQVAGRPRPLTALLFDREAGSLRTMFASGGVGFMHDMLEAAGGRNVFADVRRQNLQVSAELLLSRAPEVIIEIQTSVTWTAERIAREQEVWRGLPSLPAVRTGRIHVLVDPMLAVPGPRVADAIRLLARTLHGEAIR